MGMRNPFRSVAKIQMRNGDGFHQVSNGDGKEGDILKKPRRVVKSY